MKINEISAYKESKPAGITMQRDIKLELSAIHGGSIKGAGIKFSTSTDCFYLTRDGVKLLAKSLSQWLSPQMFVKKDGDGPNYEEEVEVIRAGRALKGPTIPLKGEKSVNGA